MAAIARDMGKNRSTIATIWMDRERIMQHINSAVPMKSTIICKRRGQALEQTERMLVQRLEDKQARRMPVSFPLIQEKATSLFEEIKAKQGEGSNEDPFVASHGWFHRFKKRANLHHVKIAGEAASADKMAAEAFPAEFKKILDEGGYSPKQVFNVDETALFWKRMPDRSYISKEEKSLPGYKVAKERITLMLGANADGSCKLKPLFVYRWENPHALRKADKSTLPVIWRSNLKAWVTKKMFEDWFSNYFVPQVKLFCAENNIPFKVLLLLDNAPGHPKYLDDVHNDVKVVNLPPNTTSLIQPMDQGVIANFKKYHTRRTYKMCLNAMDASPNMTLQEFWKDHFDI